MPLQADRPLLQAADDLLRFDRLAEGLADQVLSTRDCGLVAAVAARDSGAGRTSFLNLLHEALLGRGVPVLRLSSGAASPVLREATPLHQASPVVLVDDARPESLEDAGCQAIVIAAWAVDVDAASRQRAPLVLTLPAWDARAAEALARRVAGRDASLQEAWTRLLALARSPRQARRICAAAGAALASTDLSGRDVLAALARMLHGAGRTPADEFDRHAALFLGGVPALGAPPSHLPPPSPLPGAGDHGAAAAPARDGDDDAEPLQAHCAELARRGGPEAAEELARLLVDQRASVRLAATHAIAQLPCAVVAPLVRPLVAHQDATVRRAAAQVLGRLDDQDSFADLAGLLCDPAADARRAAAAALGRLGGGRSIAALLACLDDPHSGVRMATATALGQALEELPDDAASTATDPAPLRDALAALACVLASRHESAHSAALGALARLGVGAPASALAELLRAGTQRERDAAAAALLRVPDAVDALLPMLDDIDDVAAKAAAEILGRLGDQRAVPGLLAAHSRASAPIRQAAAASLVRLGYGG